MNTSTNYKYIIRKKLENMLGQTVEVYIDRPLGSTHPKHNETFICQRAAEKIRMRDWFIDSVENSLDTY